MTISNIKADECGHLHRKLGTNGKTQFDVFKCPVCECTIPHRHIGGRCPWKFKGEEAREKP
jgi:hypothetical protein